MSESIYERQLQDHEHLPHLVFAPVLPVTRTLAY